MSRRIALGIAGALALASPASATIITTDPSLPPTTGEYRTSVDVHAEYPVGSSMLALETVRHFGFTNIVRHEVGPDEIEQFDSIVMGDVFLNSSFLGSITMTGPVSTLVEGKVGNTVGTFDTEMLSMSLSGTLGMIQVLVRESPTLASTGSTRITDLGAGLYQIDSFFDVFTELSLDGGASWIPSSTGPAHVTLEPLVPEPGALALLAAGLLVLRLSRRAGPVTP